MTLLIEYISIYLSMRDAACQTEFMISSFKYFALPAWVNEMKENDGNWLYYIYELYNSTNTRNQAYLLLDALLLIQIYKKKNNFTQNSLSVSSSPRLVVP